MNFLIKFSRIFVGVLFIISGLIKANDPLGFAYKLDEYWEVFGLQFLSPASLFLAISICVSEVLLGWMLLLGSRIQLVSWLLLLMIIFFTFLTFYSAYFNKVTDCGCFGDALKGAFGRSLTPWESFTKDIVLLVFILIIFIGRKHISPLVNPILDNILIAFGGLAALAFPLYTYNYLPVKDFRPYAIGKNIPEQTKGIPDKLKYFYVLKDKVSGEQKEFDSWPTDWDKKYDYVTNRTEVVEKGIEPKIHDFTISSLDGADYTDMIENPKNNFLLIMYDLSKTNEEVLARINDFYELCAKDSISFIALTASPKEQVMAFKAQHNIKYEFYNTDGTVLKTMIRSNPGLMLLKGGTVQNMWHYHTIPAYNELKELLISQ